MSSTEKTPNSTIKALCACLSQRPDKLEREKLRHLSGSEWENMLQLAIEQSVAPLLFYNLNPYWTETTIPKNIFQRLHKLYLMSAVRNLRLYHELGLLLKILQQADIPVIVLKGAHLAELLYENIALRSMIDIDLLIGVDDIEDTAKCLEEAGYKPQRPYSLEAELEAACHLPPFKKGDGMSIECHWTLSKLREPFTPDIQGCWDRAHPVKLAQHETLVLSPEDLLLYLSFHLAFQHRFDLGLKALYDISEVLRHSGRELDWPKLEARASQWKSSKCLYLCLYFAREYLQAAVPDRVLHALHPDDETPQIRWRVRGQIFPSQERFLPTTHHLVQALKAKHWKDRVRTLLRHAFPPPLQMARSYPVAPGSLRLYFYYPLRLFELIQRYGGVVWRNLRHDPETQALLEQEFQGNALAEWLKQ